MVTGRSRRSSRRSELAPPSAVGAGAEAGAGVGAERPAAGAGDGAEEVTMDSGGDDARRSSTGLPDSSAAAAVGGRPSPAIRGASPLAAGLAPGWRRQGCVPCGGRTGGGESLRLMMRWQWPLPAVTVGCGPAGTALVAMRHPVMEAVHSAAGELCWLPSGAGGGQFFRLDARGESGAALFTSARREPLPSHTERCDAPLLIGQEGRAKAGEFCTPGTNS